jgi:hypothetical protein
MEESQTTKDGEESNRTHPSMTGEFKIGQKTTKIFRCDDQRCSKL